MPSMTSQSLAYWKYKPLYLKDATLKSRNILPFNYSLHVESILKILNQGL
jgi:hypothetical protein